MSIASFLLSFSKFIVFDLCEIDNGGCEHNCTNIGDSYYCTCNTGYQLNSDGTTCQEIISSMYITIYVLPTMFYLIHSICK